MKFSSFTISNYQFTISNSFGRSGAIPEPTVIVWMREGTPNGRAMTTNAPRFVGLFNC